MLSAEDQSIIAAAGPEGYLLYRHASISQPDLEMKEEAEVEVGDVQHDIKDAEIATESNVIEMNEEEQENDNNDKPEETEDVEEPNEKEETIITAENNINNNNDNIVETNDVEENENENVMNDDTDANPKQASRILWKGKREKTKAFKFGRFFILSFNLQLIREIKKNLDLILARHLAFF